MWETQKEVLERLPTPPDVDREELVRSDLGRALVKVGREFPDDYEAAREMASFVLDASYTANDHSYTDRLFQFLHQPYAMARQGHLKTFWKQDAEDLVASYLRQPRRSVLVDRILVELLVRQEFTAFAIHQLGPEAGPTPLKRWGPLLTVALNVVFGVVVVAVLSLIGWAVVEWTPLGPGWAAWPVGIIAALFAASTMLGVVTLPWQYGSYFKARKIAAALLDSQWAVVVALQGDNMVSANHIRSLVDHSAQLGTVWPSTLFVLLDDVAARGSVL